MALDLASAKDPLQGARLVSEVVLNAAHEALNQLIAEVSLRDAPPELVAQKAAAVAALASVCATVDAVISEAEKGGLDA